MSLQKIDLTAPEIRATHDEVQSYYGAKARTAENCCGGGSCEPVRLYDSQELAALPEDFGNHLLEMMPPPVVMCRGFNQCPRRRIAIVQRLLQVGGASCDQSVVALLDTQHQVTLLRRQPVTVVRRHMHRRARVANHAAP